MALPCGCAAYGLLDPAGACSMHRPYIEAKRRKPPMAVMVSLAEREHIDAVRARSYDLAVERGHVRR